MASKSGVFTNPFAIPSKSNQSKSAAQTSSELSNDQKCEKSLKTFINYIPTLSRKAAPRACNATHSRNDNRKRRLQSVNDGWSRNDNRNGGTNNALVVHKRRKRQRYPNDAGLTDAQYLGIIAARERQTEQDIANYIEQRKRKYPTKSNVEDKRKMIEVKTKRGQILSVNERIMKYQQNTGNKKTPSVLRFIKTPKFNQNVVRKVLHKEIEREHSAILQCFRFILRTKYLTEDLAESPDGRGDDAEHHGHGHGRGRGHKEDVGLNNECSFDLRDIEKDESLLEQEQEEQDEFEDFDLDLDALLPILAQQMQAQAQ